MPDRLFESVMGRLDRAGGLGHLLALDRWSTAYAAEDGGIAEDDSDRLGDAERSGRGSEEHLDEHSLLVDPLVRGDVRW
jgi:hypothetical protein